MKKRNKYLKGASVLLIAAAMVLSTVSVTADTTNIQAMSTKNFTGLGKAQYIDLEIVNVQSGLGKISADIKNTGTMDVDDVEWRISVKGGLFGFINVETTGIIPEVSIGASVTIETDKFIFGLGRVDLSIDAMYVASEGTAFVLGPFIFNLQTTAVPVVTPWNFARNGAGVFPCTIHMKCNGWAKYRQML